MLGDQGSPEESFIGWVGCKVKGVQGYLAHKKHPPPWDPTGGIFLMSQVPLYLEVFELLVGVLVVLSGPSDPLLLFLSRPEPGFRGLGVVQRVEYNSGVEGYSGGGSVRGLWVVQRGYQATMVYRA